MKRYSLSLALFLVIPLLNSAHSQESNSRSVDFLQKLQRKDGGFANTLARDAESSLRATSAAIRALQYFGKEIPNKSACSRFVLSCLDKRSGAFADRPGMQPDPVSTAVGLMAVVELQISQELLIDPSLKFLEENSRSFEEIRLSAGAFEAMGKKPHNRKEWLDLIYRLANKEGTFGDQEDRARDTGSAAVAILRLGGELVNKNAILRVLQAGQRQSGGFGKPGMEPDTETTYRVTRAFHMLQEKPKRLADLKQFIARCQNADGGYGTQPGQPSSVAATYHASIILHWFP